MTNAQSIQIQDELTPSGNFADIAPYALWGIFVALAIPVILHFMKVSRDKHTANVAEAKKRQDATSEWCEAFLGIIIPLKEAMMRAQIPSDWYGRFEISMPIMSRLTSSIPAEFDAAKSEQIVSLVSQTARLTDKQAVGNQSEIIRVLERLEVLTHDT